MKAIYPALPLVLVLAACSSTPPPTVPTPVPTPTARPTPVPLPPRVVGDWRDAPITPGDWTWRMVGNSPVAIFGPDLSHQLFQISCAPDKSAVVLSYGGVARSDALLVVTTTSMRRALPVLPGSDSGFLGQISSSVGPRDPLLDAIAFSRGRFMIEVAGWPPLYLPSWPEVSHVIEDCR